MSELFINMPTEKSSEKSFGIVFSIVFLIASLYPLINDEGLHLWALILSIIFFFLAFITPKILVYPNKLWFKFGLLLSSIISPIVMAIVYFILLRNNSIYVLYIILFIKHFKVICQRSNGINTDPFLYNCTCWKNKM